LIRSDLSLFFFQAEDGIRDFHVTGVQTCALPIWIPRRVHVPTRRRDSAESPRDVPPSRPHAATADVPPRDRRPQEDPEGEGVPRDPSYTSFISDARSGPGRS